MKRLPGVMFATLVDACPSATSENAVGLSVATSVVARTTSTGSVMKRAM
jgi:hypothetical protein